MNRLREYAAQYDIVLEDGMLAHFQKYREVLLEWNEKVNLTAITEKREMVIKHFLDSIAPVHLVPLQEGAKIIDIGTGAGFPGIPLKIIRPDIQLTLLDSLQKRVAFLQQLSMELGQENTCLHGRAEDLGAKPEFREAYTMVTARAVASLQVLCEYCLPFVQVDGVFLALKGYEIEAEVEQAAGAIEKLGGEVCEIYKYRLPEKNRRAVVVIRKKAQTPTKYPRSPAKITKAPLL